MLLAATFPPVTCAATPPPPPLRPPPRPVVRASQGCLNIPYLLRTSRTPARIMGKVSDRVWMGVVSTRHQYEAPGGEPDQGSAQRTRAAPLLGPARSLNGPQPFTYVLLWNEPLLNSQCACVSHIRPSSEANTAAAHR